MNTPTVVFLKAHRSINLNAVIAVQALDKDHNVIMSTGESEQHIPDVSLLQVQMSYGWHTLLMDQEDIDIFNDAWRQFKWSVKAGH